jgi:hypothetical protein
MITHFLARLAQSGAVRVLDGGNCFDTLALSRELRRQGPSLYSALKRVQIARAFTCYQLVTMLEEAPESALPTLVLDVLTTFRDEDLDHAERLRLLDQGLYHLHRLARHAPVLISARLTAEPAFLERLADGADRVLKFEEQQPRAQLTLW